jgi:Icc-related predicted phosphoesterase
VRILAVADRVVRRLESPRAKQHFGAFDLILGVGDLPYHYLSFIADIFGTTCLFVAGNHDDELVYDAHGYPTKGPVGWTYAHERAVDVDGFLVVGFSGSIAYNPGKPHQYSQTDMWLSVLHLAPRLWLTERRRGRPLDCLLTHSPSAGIGDGPDYAHQGFQAFRWLVDRFRPRYHVHGHVHLYGNADTAWQTYASTQVVNAYGYQIFDDATPVSPPTPQLPNYQPPNHQP